MNDTPELREKVGPVSFSDQAIMPPMPVPPGPASRLHRAKARWATTRRGGRPKGQRPKGQRTKSQGIGRPQNARGRKPPLGRRFPGPRLADQISLWGRLRSVSQLVVVSVILGILLAAIVGAVVGGIVIAVQNALNA